MKVLTCNIRNYGGSDGPNSWSYRRDIAIEAIRSRSPDIICFQEMWIEQLEDVLSAFPEFRHFGMVDEPTGKHPVNSICFRAEGFTMISAGGFWLSETPHISGSKSWDSACVRLVNWLRLEEKGTRQEFRVINTHLDHIGQVARERQAQLIVDDAYAYPDDYSQLLTGDMNCDASNKAIAIFKLGGWQDTYGTIHGTENPGHTYHGFLGPRHQDGIGKMDWVFAKGKVEVLEASVIKDAVDGRFPSDHYFVSADVYLEAQ